MSGWSANAELVRVSRPDARHKTPPHATVAGIQVIPPVRPVVVITQNADFPGVRRPDVEPRAGHAVHFIQMRPEMTVKSRVHAESFSESRNRKQPTLAVSRFSDFAERIVATGARENNSRKSPALRDLSQADRTACSKLPQVRKPTTRTCGLRKLCGTGNSSPKSR